MFPRKSDGGESNRPWLAAKMNGGLIYLNKFKIGIITCGSIVAIAILALTLIGRQVLDNDVAIKSGEYLAGGTIPADAKIYPIVDNNLSMTVVDSDKQLKSNDVWTLTHYVDIWASWDDTRNGGFKLEDGKEFVSQERIEQLTKDAEGSDRDYAIDGVQILKMQADPDGRVQVVYVVKFTGQCPDEGVKEGTYESIEGLYFQRVGDNWYEDGIGFLLMAESGTIDYERDNITGEYTIIPRDEYIS